MIFNFRRPSASGEGGTTVISGGGISRIWNTYADRLAATAGENNEQALQKDTGWVWKYSTTLPGWEKFYKGRNVYVESETDPALDVNIKDDLDSGDEWFNPIDSLLQKRTTISGQLSWKKVNVHSGSSNLELSSSSKIIIMSPDGQKYTVEVNNDGSLTTTEYVAPGEVTLDQFSDGSAVALFGFNNKLLRH